MELQESQIYCPYCGEPLTILLDVGDTGVNYMKIVRSAANPWW